MGEKRSGDNKRHESHDVVDRFLAPFSTEKKHIEVSLGTACNNRCIFCINEGRRSFVPYAQVSAEAARYASLGYDSIGFIGGDPTVYPRIADLVRECAACGYSHIHLMSNGRRYEDMAFLTSLVEAGATRFSVSIHSHRADVEDMLTGARDGFSQKLAGLDNLFSLRKSGVITSHVSLNIIMHKLVLPELDVAMRFFANMGAVDFRLLLLRMEGAAVANWETLMPRMTEVREKLPSLIRLARNRNLTLTMDSPPLCLFYDIPGLSSILAEDYYDDIITDNDSSVRAQSSWNEIRISYKTKFHFCAGCCFDHICEGVWKGYVEKLGGSEFHPVTREQVESTR